MKGQIKIGVVQVTRTTLFFPTDSKKDIKNCYLSMKCIGYEIEQFFTVPEAKCYSLCHLKSIHPKKSFSYLHSTVFSALLPEPHLFFIWPNITDVYTCNCLPIFILFR